MDCVCMPFRGWMGKTKYLSAFEWGMVVGARRTNWSVSRTATLLSILRSTVMRVYQEWSATQRPSIQLDTTVGSIGVEMGQPCGMLSTPCSLCPDELRLFWGQKGVWLNIRKVFLMFCTLSVCFMSYLLNVSVMSWKQPNVLLKNYTNKLTNTQLTSCTRLCQNNCNPCAVAALFNWTVLPLLSHTRLDKMTHVVVQGIRFMLMWHIWLNLPVDHTHIYGCVCIRGGAQIGFTNYWIIHNWYTQAVGELWFSLPRFSILLLSSS